MNRNTECIVVDIQPILRKRINNNTQKLNLGEVKLNTIKTGNFHDHYCRMYFYKGL